MTKKKLLTFCVIICFAIVACDYEYESESGISYSGQWKEIEKARLTLKSDSVVSAEIWSAEFVGYFNDRISGIYEIQSDSLMIIRWKDVKSSNDVYTEVPAQRDTFHIIGDTLRKYVGGMKEGWDAYGDKCFYQEKYSLIKE